MKCEFCGEEFEKDDLDYPRKGSPYKSCASCRSLLENEAEEEN